MSSVLDEYDYYLKTVLARKKLFISIVLLVMTMGVVVAYMLPSQYEASTTVFLEQNVITDLVKGIAVTPSVEAKLKMLSVSLLSRTMIMKVLNELDRDLLLQNERQAEEYLATITKQVKISYKERQGVFRISLRDSDPIFASDFVNTLTRKYIDTNTSSKRDESFEANKFLAEQIDSFKRRIDVADEAINNFKSEKGLILASDEVYLRGEINNAEKRLEDLVIKRNELESKKRIFLERGPEPGKLSEAEARLSELLGRYTSEHPKVVAAHAEVARLRSGRGDSNRKVNTTAAREGLQMLQVEIDAFKEMEARQLRILEENKNLLREIPNVKAALAELVRKKENESVVYQQLVSRYGQSEVSKQMELQDKSITFRILDPAVKPLAPVSPNRMLIIMGSAGAGLGIGFAVIFLLDLFKGGIKSPSALKDFDLPVFAVIPHMTDVVSEVKQLRVDRIFLIFAAGYLVLMLSFAAADLFKLDERAQSASKYVSRKISSTFNK